MVLSATAPAGILDKFRTALGGMWEFLPNDELKLAIIGGLVVLAFFFFALIFSARSRVNVLRRQFLAASGKINAMGNVDDENVRRLYEELQSLPEAVTAGWGKFLEQKTGYPSDYIPAKDVLGEGEYSGKNSAVKVMFRIFGCFAVCVLTALLDVGLFEEDWASVGIADFATSDFTLAVSVLTVVLIPLTVFLICNALLTHVYNKQTKRLRLVFSSFQDALDDKVVIGGGGEEEQRDIDNLADIGVKVDELIFGRMEDEIPTEIMRVPEASKEEETAALFGLGSEPSEPSEPSELAEPAEPAEPSEPAEPVSEQASRVDVSPETRLSERAEPIIAEEDVPKYLKALVSAVDDALADSRTSDNEIEEIVLLIDAAKQEIFTEEKDIRILDECLTKLASWYYG